MYKTIFIGGINRSGGSFLQRMFDGHSKIASYPLEYTFPRDNSLYKIFESYSGIPFTVPTLTGQESKEEIYQMMALPLEKPEVITKWGKEQSDPIGIRKNYLEKAFYDDYETDFDFGQFIDEFEVLRKKANNIVELYEARHRAYFNAWDNGAHAKSAEYVCMHDSAGVYLNNIGRFLNEFPDSTFIYPVRDIYGYIASEKTRLARRYFGSRRFSWPKFPNQFVKMFDQYDLTAQINAWMIALTRGVVLQEKFGVNGKMVVYRYENLLNRTENVMQVLCEKIGIDFDPVVLEPTMMGKPWGGNSHQGKQKGVSKQLANYYPKVLRQDKMDQIDAIAGKAREFLVNLDQTPVDLTTIPKEYLYDYDFQKKHCDDQEKYSLYSALVNAPRRRMMVKAPSSLAILALLYSWYVRILHIPRMWKLKLFPGMGKQNYT